MLFSALGIHHDEQLLITTDPWDERRARELMQEELLIRLYNHVYADPVYWSHLDVEARIFQLASAIAGRRTGCHFLRFNGGIAVRYRLCLLAA